MQNNSPTNLNFLHHSCPVCESGMIHYNFENDGGQVFQCEDCDFLFLNSGSVRGVVSDQKSKSAINEEKLRKYLDQITQYYGKKEGSLLCIGDNKGLPFLAKEAGFDAVGMDNLGKDLPRQKFNICALINVLEYDINPIGTLKRVHELLVPGGVIFIATSSLKNIWSGLKTKQANYFDYQTIQNALNKTAFNQVCISPDYKSVLARSKPLSATPKLSIIVPVFNEVNTFPQLIATLLGKELTGVEKEIIIIESNSTDGTREKVLGYNNKPGVTVVLEEKPKGKGAAVRNGLSRATGDFILIQDGDLEYDINDYDQLLIPLLNYRRAFVLGSRHQKGFKMRHFETAPVTSFIMNVGQKFFVTLLNLFCWQKLKDPFTMYKVFRRDCLYGLTFGANRFDFDFELVIKLLRKGYVPLEIPINYKSRSFSEGKKVSIIRDPLTWIVALFRYRFERLYQNKYYKDAKIDK